MHPILFVRVCLANGAGIAVRQADPDTRSLRSLLRDDNERGGSLRSGPLRDDSDGYCPAAVSGARSTRAPRSFQFMIAFQKSAKFPCDW